MTTSCRVVTLLRWQKSVHRQTHRHTNKASVVVYTAIRVSSTTFCHDDRLTGWKQYQSWLATRYLTEILAYDKKYQRTFQGWSLSSGGPLVATESKAAYVTSVEIHIVTYLHREGCYRYTHTLPKSQQLLQTCASSKEICWCNQHPVRKLIFSLRCTFQRRTATGDLLAATRKLTSSSRLFSISLPILSLSCPFTLINLNSFLFVSQMSLLVFTVGGVKMISVWFLTFSVCCG